MQAFAQRSAAKTVQAKADAPSPDAKAGAAPLAQMSAALNGRGAVRAQMARAQALNAAPVAQAHGRLSPGRVLAGATVQLNRNAARKFIQDNGLNLDPNNFSRDDIVKYAKSRSPKFVQLLAHWNAGPGAQRIAPDDLKSGRAKDKAIAKAKKARRLAAAAPVAAPAAAEESGDDDADAAPAPIAAAAAPQPAPAPAKSADSSDSSSSDDSDAGSAAPAKKAPAASSIKIRLSSAADSDGSDGDSDDGSPPPSYRAPPKPAAPTASHSASSSSSSSSSSSYSSNAYSAGASKAGAKKAPAASESEGDDSDSPPPMSSRASVKPAPSSAGGSAKDGKKPAAPKRLVRRSSSDDSGPDSPRPMRSKALVKPASKPSSAAADSDGDSGDRDDKKAWRGGGACAHYHFKTGTAAATAFTGDGDIVDPETGKKASANKRIAAYKKLGVDAHFLSGHFLDDKTLRSQALAPPKKKAAKKGAGEDAPSGNFSWASDQAAALAIERGRQLFAHTAGKMVIVDIADGAGFGYVHGTDRKLYKVFPRKARVVRKGGGDLTTAYGVTEVKDPKLFATAYYRTDPAVGGGGAGESAAAASPAAAAPVDAAPAASAASLAELD